MISFTRFHKHILPYTLLHVAYMTSARCEVSCWQQQLECEWNTNPQNFEADAQSTKLAGFLPSDNVLAQPSVFFSVGLLGTKFQIPHFLF